MSRQGQLSLRDGLKSPGICIAQCAMMPQARCTGNDSSIATSPGQRGLRLGQATRHGIDVAYFERQPCTLACSCWTPLTLLSGVHQMWKATDALAQKAALVLGRPCPSVGDLLAGSGIL